VSHDLFIVVIRVTALQQCRSSPNDSTRCLFGRPNGRSESDSSHRRGITCDRRITGEQCDAFDERLGDEDTVERVFV